MQRNQRIIVGLLAVSALVTTNWIAGAPAFQGPGYLRMQSPFVDSVALLLALCLPSVALLLAVRLLKGPARPWLGGLAGLGVVASLPLLLVAGINASQVLRLGHSGALTPIAEATLGDSDRFTLYQTNGGAATSFGVLLRRERKLLPGLRWTRNVANWHPADTAWFDVAGDIIQVRGLPSGQPFRIGQGPEAQGIP